MIVAIDGPAASGKSTAAIGVAKALNITHLDTGAMYRAITFGLIKTFSARKQFSSFGTSNYSAFYSRHGTSSLFVRNHSGDPSLINRVYGCGASKSSFPLRSFTRQNV